MAGLVGSGDSGRGGRAAPLPDDARRTAGKAEEGLLLQEEVASTTHSLFLSLIAFILLDFLETFFCWLVFCCGFQLSSTTDLFFLLVACLANLSLLFSLFPVRNTKHRHSFVVAPDKALGLPSIDPDRSSLHHLSVMSSSSLHFCPKSDKDATKIHMVM